MRHRMRGRKLGRNAAHRRAMFRNMAGSLIRSVRVDEDDPRKPRVPGRIVTTLAKAKELRPFVEKLITLARKATEHQDNAREFATSADRGSTEWKSWRESEQWNRWNQAIAPAVAIRRRAFALLRDKEAVDVLFDELVDRFEDRPGGYTRVVRLPQVRLGDAGRQALIEFVGERDRVKAKRKAPVVTDEPDEESAAPTEEEAGNEMTGQAESGETSDESTDTEEPQTEQTAEESTDEESTDKETSS
jgi:large subunit ribosomal protein L17